MVHTFHPHPETMTERTRFTISVEPDVYEAFADLAHASGVSLSRCIGDWLRDTAEAAQMTTIRVNEVRKSPDEAFRAWIGSQAREMPAFIERLRQTSTGLVREQLGFDRAGGGHGAAVVPAGQPVRRGSGAAGAAGRHGEPAQPAPPASNTGGKSPGNTRRSR